VTIRIWDTVDGTSGTVTADGDDLAFSGEDFSDLANFYRRQSGLTGAALLHYMVTRLTRHIYAQEVNEPG
jgi:hypothetical protein